MEKRLSGELDKIVQPTQQVDFKNVNLALAELKLILAVLEERRAGKSFRYGELALLRAGEKHLILAAANKPSSYLSALKRLRQLGTSNEAKGDIAIVQTAIQQLIGIEPIKPNARTAFPERNLSRSYFNYLKNGN
ncbi:MAG: hypothetical protein EOO07_01630 [Chitinophagaceae bacterium]|nr:MAG: hypothetical protein EOO07_01630 [Chitinophagaceae bacterium]